MSRHSSRLRQTQLQPASPVEGQDTAPGELLHAGCMTSANGGARGLGVELP